MKIKDGADLNLDSRVFQKVLEGNNHLIVTGDEPKQTFLVLWLQGRVKQSTYFVIVYVFGGNVYNRFPLW